MANKKSSSKSSKVKKPTPAPKPALEPENDGDMPPSADDAAAEILDNAVKNTPWWAMSLAFHGIVLASLPLIVFSSTLLAADNSTPQIIKLVRPATQKIEDIMPSELRTVRESPGVEGTTKDQEVPMVKFPNAELDDHFESADGEDHRSIKGDSWDAASYMPGTDNGIIGRMPGAGAGTNESIGVGGGAGSGRKFGGNLGGRFNKYMKVQHTATGSAVKFGLIWLARHQHPDGHWSTEGFHAQCPAGKCSGAGLSDFDVGNTGLALLGFLGAGYTPGTRSFYVDPVTKKKTSFGEVVQKGMKWLIEHQNAEGAIGPQIGEMMYNHAIAALALSEAYGLTSAPAYRIPAQKAINFLVTAQNYNLGWRYTPRCNNNDTSVTGWCVMALKSAQISNLEVPQTSFLGAKAWLDRVTDSTGQVGYDRLGSGDIYVPGKNEKWQHHPSMTAVGVLCRIFIDKKKGEKVLESGAKIVMADMPRWDTNAAKPSVDFYYWYYATLALFQYDAEGPLWEKWNKAVTGILCDHQRTSKDGCLDGSWDTENVDRWAYAGGRVYGTAINVLTLETGFRYEAVFGSAKRGK